MSESLLGDLEAQKLRAEIELLSIQSEKERADITTSHIRNKLAEREIKLLESSPQTTRELSFWGDITTSSVATTVHDIECWTRRDPGQPIYVTFNTNGGGVFPGFALYDFLRELSSKGTPVVTKTIGLAASMGAVLLQAGDERIMSPNSYLMLHEVSTGLEGKFSELEDSVGFTKDLQGRVLDALAERSTLSFDEIYSRIKHKDWWLNATQARDLGFVDTISY